MLAGVHYPLQLDVFGPEADAVTDHELTTSQVRRQGHFRGIAPRQSDGLFAKNVLPCGEGLKRDGAVEVCRQADVHDRTFHLLYGGCETGKYRNAIQLSRPQGLAKILTPWINNAYNTCVG
jgi:hypothetical protein